MTAYSELGHGTTFKVYLPRVDEPLEPWLDGSAVGEAASRGTETVLLAEDEESLRLMFREVIEGVVLEAASPEAALAVSESHEGPIHLFVTDIVMPRMGGQEARRVLAIRPDVRVLFVSGCFLRGIGHQGLIEPGTNFLPAPPEDRIAAAYTERQSDVSDFGFEGLLAGGTITFTP